MTLSSSMQYLLISTVHNARDNEFLFSDTVRKQNRANAISFPETCTFV
jgi:hypothetical protein